MKNKTNKFALVNISSLAELCNKITDAEYLISEWHPTRNQNIPPYGITLIPDSVTPTDSRIVWWQCKKGHSWADTVKHRVEGLLNGTDNGCIFCTPEKIKRARILWDYCTAEMPDGEIDCSYLLKEWDYEKNYPLTPKDVKTVEYRKVWWKCEKGHGWQALISNRVKAGVGCPYCGHRLVLKGVTDLETLYPVIAKEWDYEKNQAKPDEITAYSNRKAWWKCSEGHSYQNVVSNRTKRGQGCPVCRAIKNEKGSMLIKGVNDLATTHSELILEWNHEKNDISPSDVKAGSRRIVWWKCKNGHEWQTPVSRRTNTRRIGCPECRTVKI